MHNRIDYYQQLFAELNQQCQLRVAGHPAHSDESNQLLLDDLQQILTGFAQQADYVDLAGEVLLRIISHYPDITPLVHRDLLWFCGGQCLHYLGDEELDRYQLLEDRYFEKPDAHYRDLRAQVFGLH